MQASGVEVIEMLGIRTASILAMTAILAMPPTTSVVAQSGMGGVPGSGPGARGQGSWGPETWGMGGGAMMGPGMMGGRGLGFMCNPRAAGMAEWRIARIEAAVRPTEAQRGALQDLRSASAKAAGAIAEACKVEVPATPKDRLALMEKRIEALLQAVRIVRPAFDAFYDKLDAEQQKRIDAASPRRWGWQSWHWQWQSR